jgi:hypothetical protein
MRWRPARAQRSVGHGVRAGRLLSLEMGIPGCRRGRNRRKATSLVAFSRAVSGQTPRDRRTRACARSLHAENREDLDRDGHLADTACWRRHHASSSHARGPRPATSDKTKGSPALARPTASKRVSSPPGRDHPLRVGRHRRGNHNSKPRKGDEKATARCKRPNRRAAKRTRTGETTIFSRAPWSFRL